MKKLILIVTVAMILAACGGGARSYTLMGTVDSLYNGAQAYLSYGETVDSVLVTEGTFCFEGHIDTAVMAHVTVIKGKHRAGGQVIIEAGTPTLALVANDAVCGGTPLNDAYYRYVKQSSSLTSGYVDAYTKLYSNKDITEEERQARIKEAYDVYNKNYMALNKELFAANTNNLLGAEAMLSMALDDKHTFDSLYMIAGDVLRKNPKVVSELKRYEKMEKTSVGKMFTDFTIKNGAADGSSVSLSDYVGKGKYVLVDFWASWCGPCRKEIPNIADVHEKYKGDKFEVVGVAVWDERVDTEKAKAELSITWPIIYDAQDIPGDIYGFSGIPEIILFGPDGTILERGLSLRGEQMSGKVGEYLNGE